jgi:small subunit ribosomal protein S16
MGVPDAGRSRVTLVYYASRVSVTTALPQHSTAIAIRRDSSLMVKIRLMRTGMKGAASYRVVIADARSPRDGRIIENIGWYNPRTDPATITIDAERAKHWLSVGAQPSDSVRSLLQRSGVLPRPARAANPAASPSR